MSAPPEPWSDMPWQAVAGGNVSRAARVTLDDGGLVFVKWHDAVPDGMFAAEAAGLDLLRSHVPANVPQVVDQQAGWLALEWIERGTATHESGSVTGAMLARLHAATNERFGLERDNFMGPSPQRNGWHDSFAELWLVCRIEPILRRVRDRGVLDAADSRLVAGAAERVAAVCPEEPPRLTHGDLWAGNLHVGADGRPWLIDPAVSWSHRETDLAMMRLFGGFGPECWARYDELLPIADGFDERCPGLQLHPLLLHADLFGGRYIERVRAAAQAVG